MTDYDNLIVSLRKKPCPTDFFEKIEWCRSVIALCTNNKLSDAVALDWLIAFDSETDHLPSSKNLARWSPDALKKIKDEYSQKYANDLDKLESIQFELVNEIMEKNQTN